MAIEKTGELLGEETRKLVEAEHGPVVAVSHPDGSCFAFRRMGRDEFSLRRKRVARGDQEADDKLLQERCVWPSRQAWNEYVAKAAFEPLSYLSAYKRAHGGAECYRADPAELPEDADTSLTWIANGEQVFAFRKPARPEVKMFQSAVLAADPDVNPVENLLRACSKSDAFPAWLDANLFGVDAFGDAFVALFGMVSAGQVVVK